MMSEKVEIIMMNSFGDERTNDSITLHPSTVARSEQEKLLLLRNEGSLPCSQQRMRLSRCNQEAGQPCTL